MSLFDSHNTLEGHRATESAHRKVELQSPADLTYLVANLSRAAREKIDKHFPPDAVAAGEEGGDEMRKRVEELVDQYIQQVFTSAKPSISINGLSSSEMDSALAQSSQEEVELEPFDTKLAQRLQSLSAQIESHTLSLANLRRTAPAETAKKWEEGFLKEGKEWNERFGKEEEERLKEASAVDVGVGASERQEEVRRTFERGQEELSGLKKGMGGTVARMEKAQKAVEVVEEK